MTEHVGLDVLVDAPQKLSHALVSGGDGGEQIGGEPHSVTVDLEHPAGQADPVGLQGVQVEPPVVEPADHLGGWLVPREQAVGHLVDRGVEEAEPVEPPVDVPAAVVAGHAGVAELDKIDAATRRARRPLRGRDKIALAVGKVINAKKVAKHFLVDIADDGLSWRRDEDKIAAEAALDGIYVIRTSRPSDVLGAGAAVESYKALENVERVFRGLNTDLLIRPIRHRLAARVRAHVLIRLLACYVTWHMQQRLAPVLFQDDDPAAGRALRPSPVAPARRSPSALAKITTKVTDDGSPVHSLRSLLADLGTICANRIQPAAGLPAFTLITTPTPVQRRAFELLGLSCRLGYA